MSENNNLPKIEYYSLEEAAEELGCTIQNLLHWGITGKLEICARFLGVANIPAWTSKIPIDVIEGLKISPDKMQGLKDKSLDWKQVFALLQLDEKSDLYASSSKGEKIWLDIYGNIDFAECIFGVMDAYSLLKIDKEGLLTFDNGFDYRTSWFDFSRNIKYEFRLGFIHKTPEVLLSGSFNVDYVPIEKKDLFIMSEEMKTLKQGGKQVENNLKKRLEKVHGNTFRNIEKREEVLKAALYCKHNFPEKCTDGAKWAKTIDEKAPLFWKKDGRPPYSLDKISRMINESLKTSDEKVKKR